MRVCRGQPCLPGLPLSAQSALALEHGVLFEEAGVGLHAGAQLVPARHVQPARVGGRGRAGRGRVPGGR